MTYADGTAAMLDELADRAAADEAREEAELAYWSATPHRYVEHDRFAGQCRKCALYPRHHRGAS